MTAAPHLQREFRLMAYVGRWQIVQVNRRQSIAEHSYFVAIIAWRLVEDLRLMEEPEFSTLDLAGLFREALLHDVSETISADIPSPAHRQVKKSGGAAWKEWLTAQTQRFFPWYEEKPDLQVKDLVSLADLIEAILFLTEEMGMGNQYVEHHRASLMLALANRVEALQWSPALKYRLGRWISATIEAASSSPKVLTDHP